MDFLRTNSSGQEAWAMSQQVSSLNLMSAMNFLGSLGQAILLAPPLQPEDDNNSLPLFIYL